MTKRASIISRRALSRGRYLTLAGTSFLVAIAVWSFLSIGHFVNPLLLPTPLSVAHAFVQLFSDSTFLSDIGISVYRVMLGFAISVILGVPLGIAIGTYKPAKALLEPINDFLRYIPVPAFLP